MVAAAYLIKAYRPTGGTHSKWPVIPLVCIYKEGSSRCCIIGFSHVQA